MMWTLLISCILMITSVSGYSYLYNCRDLTVGISECENYTQPVDSLEIHIQWINETHISLSWKTKGNYDTDKITIEKNCHINHTLMTTVIVSNNPQKASTMPHLVEIPENADYCIINGCTAKSDSCYKNITNPVIVSPESTDVTKTLSIIDLLSGSASPVPEPTKPQSIRTNTIITTITTITEASSIAANKSLSIITSIQWGRGSSSVEPSLGDDLSGQSSIILVSIALFVIIMGMLSMLALCLSCLTKRHLNKKRRMYFYGSQELTSHYHEGLKRLNTQIDNGSFKGSVVTLVQELESKIPNNMSDDVPMMIINGENNNNNVEMFNILHSAKNQLTDGYSSNDRGNIITTSSPNHILIVHDSTTSIDKIGYIQSVTSDDDQGYNTSNYITSGSYFEMNNTTIIEHLNETDTSFCSGLSSDTYISSDIHL